MFTNMEINMIQQESELFCWSNPCPYASQHVTIPLSSGIRTRKKAATVIDYRFSSASVNSRLL